MRSQRWKTHFSLAPVHHGPGWVSGPAECGARARHHSLFVTDLPSFVSCRKCLAKRDARAAAGASPFVGQIRADVRAGVYGERFIAQRLDGGGRAYYLVDSADGRILAMYDEPVLAIREAAARNDAIVRAEYQAQYPDHATIGEDQP